MKNQLSFQALPSVANNTITTLATKLLVFGISFATNVAIARLLGPHGQGIYSSTILVWTFGTLIAGLGIGTANTAFASRGKWSSSELIGNSLFFIVFSVLCSGVALFAIEVGILPGKIGELTISQVEIAVVLVPLGVAVGALGGLMLGFNRLKEWNIIFVLLGTVVTFIVLLGLVGGLRLGLEGAIIAWVFGQVAVMVVGCWRLLPRASIRLMMPPGLLKESLWFGVRANMAQLVGTLNFRLDSLIVLYLLGARDVGLYAVTVLIAEWLYFIPASIANALFPRFGSAGAEEVVQLTNRALRLTLSFALAGAIALAISVPLILGIFGEQYLSALPTFFVLLPGVAIYGLAHITTVYWYGYARKPQVNLMLAGISLIVDLLAIFVLVPHIGLQGAGLASTIAYVSSMSISIFLYLFFLILRSLLLNRRLG